MYAARKRTPAFSHPTFYVLLLNMNLLKKTLCDKLFVCCFFFRKKNGRILSVEAVRMHNYSGNIYEFNAMRLAIY